MNKRTHTCGELNPNSVDKSIILNGWVNTIRLHGQVVFVDLRDRYGKTQIIFNSEDYSGDFDVVKKLSMEDVISVIGKVQNREKKAIKITDIIFCIEYDLCFSITISEIYKNHLPMETNRINPSI
jgi:aspartyl-tRNA synthetase